MEQEIREIIRRELPRLLTEDPELYNWVWTIVHEHSFSRAETESRFDKVLDEMRQSREEWMRRWEENERRWQENERRWKQQWEEDRRRWEENARLWRENEERWRENEARWKQQWEEDRRRWEENARLWRENEERWKQQWEEDRRRWEENARLWRENEARWKQQWEEDRRRWEENQQQIRALLEEVQRQGEELQRMGKEIQRQGEEVQRVDRRIDQTIGALGARLGMMSEETFRNALRGILEENFGVKVERVQYKDESGEVFGRPDQVELDVVIYDGQMLVCEIKSSASRADVYAFERKVRSYEKRVGRKADRAILISPMIENTELARTLGIEVYTRAEDVRLAP
jgi:hypothetical protein